MLEAIASLQSHPTTDRAAFDADELLRHFAWKKVEIIGEAASKLTPELRAASTEVPWSQIIGMRHRLVHDYADVDWDVLWDVLQNHIEPLRVQIARIVEQRNE